MDASPFSQAAKNFSLVSPTSSSPGGPLLASDDPEPPSPSSADTTL
ncbi:hypothetical protein RKD32_003038 [Streptomyces sp. SAI-195]